jgi:hypothetical protein
VLQAIASQRDSASNAAVAMPCSATNPHQGSDARCPHNFYHRSAPTRYSPLENPRDKGGTVSGQGSGRRAGGDRRCYAGFRAMGGLIRSDAGSLGRSFLFFDEREVKEFFEIFGCCCEAAGILEVRDMGILIDDHEEDITPSEFLWADDLFAA